MKHDAHTPGANRGQDIEEDEERLGAKLLDYTESPQIQAQMGEAFFIWKDDPELTEEDIEPTLDDLAFSRFFDWFVHDYKQLTTGESVIDAFRNLPTVHLDEEERQYYDALAKSTYRFLEIVDSTGESVSTMVDIFTGETLLIHHRPTEERVSSASIICARVVDFMATLRLFGLVSMYPLSFKPLIEQYFEDGFNSAVSTLGKPLTKTEFLKEQGYLVVNYAVELAGNRVFITGDGEKISFTRLRFEVTDLEGLIDIFEAESDLVEIPGGSDQLRVYYWMEPDTKGMIGTLDMEDDTLTITTHTEEYGERARVYFTELLHGYAGLVATDSQPLTQTDTEHGQPEGGDGSTDTERELDLYYEQWIHTPHKSLGGKPPIDCMEDREDKRRLVSLLKELYEFYERSRTRGEPYYDINKLYGKLKLSGTPAP